MLVFVETPFGNFEYEPGLDETNTDSLDQDSVLNIIFGSVTDKTRYMYKVGSSFHGREELFDGCNLELKLINTEQNYNDLQTVKQDGMQLQWVEEQTKDICLAAVENEPRAFMFVKQDLFNVYDLKEICLAAFTLDGSQIEHLDQSRFQNSDLKEISLAAIKNNYDALQFVNHKLFDKQELKQIYLRAVSNVWMDTKSFVTDFVIGKFTIEDQKEIILAAISSNAEFIRGFDFSDFDLKTQKEFYIAAIKSSQYALEQIPFYKFGASALKEIFIEAKKKDPNFIRNIPKHRLSLNVLDVINQL